VVKPVPEKWGDDRLSSFIENATGNTYATFANLKGEWRKLQGIDGLFQCVVDHLDNPPDLVGAIFLPRTHSAYRGAVRLAISGQLPEAYSVLRTCLEWGLYALSMQEDPSDAEVWLRRHEDEDSKRRVRQRFQMARMMDLLTVRSDRVGKIVRELYERCIDFGAHPNELSLTTNGSLKRGPQGQHVFEAVYLEELSDALRLAIRTTAQIGVGALEIFQLFFPERFKLLGVTAGLKASSAGL